MNSRQVMAQTLAAMTGAGLLAACGITPPEGLETHSERLAWLAEHSQSFVRLGEIRESATQAAWVEARGTLLITVESFVWIGEDQFLLYGALTAPMSASGFSQPRPAKEDVDGEYIVFSLATAKREINPQMGDSVRYQGRVITESTYGRALGDLAEGRNPMIWLPKFFGKDVAWTFPVKGDDFVTLRGHWDDR